MNVTWSLIPAICMVAAAEEGTNALFYRLVNECLCLAESIQDTASADLHAAQIKIRGTCLMGLSMSASFNGRDIEPNATLQEKLVAEIKRIKDADFYGSRILLAAYADDKLATLPPPTEEEKMRVHGQFISRGEAILRQAAGVNNRQSAEAYCLDWAATMLMARYAQQTGLIHFVSDAELQTLLRAMHQADTALNTQLKEHNYYGSPLVKDILR